MSNELRLLPSEPLPDELIEAEKLAAEYRALREDAAGRRSSRPTRIGEIMLDLDADQVMRAADPPPRRRGRSREEKEAYARHLREHMTPAEWALWLELESWAADGIVFEAQAIVRGWIVDFYAPELRLVVEVDGGIHSAASQYHRDQHRDTILRRDGYSVVRVTNRDVLSGYAARLILGEIADMEGHDAS